MARICLVSGEYPPQLGGVAGYTGHLAQALTRCGYEVEVITCTRPGLKNGSKGSAVRVASVLPAGSFGLIAGWRLVRHIQRQRYTAAIFQYVPHLYGRAGIAPVAAFVPLLLRLGGIPTVCTMFHEIRTGLNERPGSPKTWLQWLFHVIQALLLVMFTQKLITSTPANARFLQNLAKLLGQKKNCEIIPIGSNIALNKVTSPELARLKSSLHLNVTEPLLLVFSPFTAGKDLEICLKTLQQLPEAALVCVGGLPNPARAAALQAQAQASGVADRLRIIPGPLDESELSRWLQIADVYLHTATAGASGRSSALTAALQHGLAIISYSGQHTSPAFVNGENILLVEPGDLEAIVSHLRRLCAQPALLEKLRSGATRLYNTTASWDIIGQRYCRQVLPC